MSACKAKREINGKHPPTVSIPCACLGWVVARVRCGQFIDVIKKEVFKGTTDAGHPECSPFSTRSACSPSFFPACVQRTHTRDLESFYVSPLTPRLPKSYQPLRILPPPVPTAASPAPVQAPSILSLPAYNWDIISRIKITQRTLIYPLYRPTCCSHFIPVAQVLLSLPPHAHACTHVHAHTHEHTPL